MQRKTIHSTAHATLAPATDKLRRYFLFHSALVLMLCALSFRDDPEMQQWHEDIRLARSIFKDNLGEDSLSARCVSILDQVLSDDTTNHNLFPAGHLDKDALSTFPWSVETNELFESFDWDLSTNGF